MMQEVNFIHCGDYYIPDIRLPEKTRPIDRWRRMHRDYIKEHKPIRFNDLCLSGEQWMYQYPFVALQMRLRSAKTLEIFLI